MSRTPSSGVRKRLRDRTLKFPKWPRPSPKQAISEDCLHLNVWTNGLDARKRPVMVWLHGGGFTSGSGSYTMYDGANMARKHDVVTVTVNHRLNSFGFLYLADIGGAKFANASNAGMLDVVAALEWVRDNIANFGGDPNNVTIFGQSGGAGKVSTLLAMPAAKGLFHRAIVQSGANVKGVSARDATKTAQTLMDKLGVKTRRRACRRSRWISWSPPRSQHAGSAAGAGGGRQDAARRSVRSHRAGHLGRCSAADRIHRIRSQLLPEYQARSDRRRGLARGGEAGHARRAMPTSTS